MGTGVPKSVLRWRGWRLVILAIAALFVWTLLFPHESSTSGPVSLDEAGDCPIPLPKSARNIQFYSRTQWNFFEVYVRFEAPPQDCLDHVDVVLAHWRKTFSESEYPDSSPGPLVTIERPPEQSTGKRYGDPEPRFGWYDPYNIEEGVTTQSYGGGNLSISVDTRRGVFYYSICD